MALLVRRDAFTLQTKLPLLPAFVAAGRFLFAAVQGPPPNTPQGTVPPGSSAVNDSQSTRSMCTSARYSRRGCARSFWCRWHLWATHCPRQPRIEAACIVQRRRRQEEQGAVDADGRSPATGASEHAEHHRCRQRGQACDAGVAEDGIGGRVARDRTQHVRNGLRRIVRLLGWARVASKASVGRSASGAFADDGAGRSRCWRRT